MVISRASVSSDDKREAMQRVLRSKALSRSEQLRSFLQYICEAEISGSAGEINEYAIGVAALGRSADYSPAVDSCVRTRAYELRNKLRFYYEQQSPNESIRIRIDKGAYVPSFELSSGSASTAEKHPPGGVEASDVDALWEPFRTSAAPLLIAFDLRLFFYAPATGQGAPKSARSVTTRVLPSPERLLPTLHGT